MPKYFGIPLSLPKYLVVYPPEMGEVYRCEGGQNKRVERREYKMGEGGERGGVRPPILADGPLGGLPGEY